MKTRERKNYKRKNRMSLLKWKIRRQARNKEMKIWKINEGF